MFIKWFAEINGENVKEAGGKGASLGEMIGAGIPVPPGFVVLAEAFERFLEESELVADMEAILKKVNHKDINSVDRASNEIRKLIAEEKMPEDLQDEILKAYRNLFSPSLNHSRQGREKKMRNSFPLRGHSASSSWSREGGKVGGYGLVAVRSSATAEDSKTASWAGELETYLNVTESRLLGAVKKCWSSLFTPRAIFYRFEKKLHKKAVSVAVVVQEMVQSEVSGICFTVHPVTEDRNQIVIEAGFGLGEAIVGGMVTPDTYVVHKRDFSILDINVSLQSMAIVRSPTGNAHRKLSAKIGGRQKLTGRQIVELAKICKNIEQRYNHPQDIEWAYAKGKFYITQSRPITTL